MYKITEEQKRIIIDGFYEANAPVRMYKQMQILLNSLPKIIKEEKVVAKNNKI